MKTYDIPISSNYVDNWGVKEALRELRANANDGSLSPSQYGIEFNNEGNVFCWNAATEKLAPSTLVLGNSTKNGDDDNIGQFGEGYKLALVVLLREGKTVKIHNLDELWHVSFKHSQTFDTETLHIEVENLAKNSNVIAFDIDNVTMDEYKGFEAIHIEHIMPDLEHIHTEEGQYTVYGIKADIEALLDENAASRNLIGTLSLSMTDEEQELLNFSIKKNNTELNRIDNISGVYMGGLRVESSNGRFVINLHPSAARLSRDRDSISEGHEVVTKARTKALLLSRKSWTKESIGMMDSADFCSSLDAEEKAEFLVEILSILEVTPIDGEILHIEQSSVEPEAKKLGISLPVNAYKFDWSTRNLLQRLGLVVTPFAHPVLTNSLQDVVKSIAEKHAALLMKDGNEVLLKEFKIIQTLAESWRGY